jgi:predicted RNA binding protein YcfA (HicA-like mRNA interferase family)
MTLPRDLCGADLIRALGKLGYEATRQSGSHVRLTTTRGGVHHITVPAHDPIKVGTLASILNEVREHTGMSRDELIRVLF